MKGSSCPVRAGPTDPQARTEVAMFASRPSPLVSVLAAVASAAAACGGSALNQTSITCPAGRTLLDGVCVNEGVADYVACVRAQGATLGGERSEKISADAGYLGVRAAGAAEVSENLERKYAVSDAATLEIVRACSARSGIGQTELPVAAAAPPADELAACKKREFKGHEYALCMSVANWDAAQGKCSKAGGSLAKIDSAEEQEFVRQMISDEGVNTWIGLRRDSHCQWRWPGGEPVGFSAWGAGQPDGTCPDQECAHLWAEVRFAWDNNGCGNKQPFLCERTP